MANHCSVGQVISPSSIKSKRSHFWLISECVISIANNGCFKSTKLRVVDNKRPHTTRSFGSLVPATDCKAFSDTKARERATIQAVKKFAPFSIYGNYNVGDTIKRLKSNYSLPRIGLGYKCPHPTHRNSWINRTYSTGSVRWLKFHVSSLLRLF